MTFADPPPGLHAGAVSYGPVLNAAAVLLACYGNVPPERAAAVMGMLLGVPVSAGWVDKAAARIAAQLGKAGFDEAMLAALAGGEGAGRRRDPGERAGQEPRSPRHGKTGRSGPGGEGEGAGRAARRTC